MTAINFMGRAIINHRVNDQINRAKQTNQNARVNPNILQLAIIQFKQNPNDGYRKRPKRGKIVAASTATVKNYQGEEGINLSKTITKSDNSKEQITVEVLKWSLFNEQ